MKRFGCPVHSLRELIFSRRQDDDGLLIQKGARSFHFLPPENAHKSGKRSPFNAARQWLRSLIGGA